MELSGRTPDSQSLSEADKKTIVIGTVYKPPDINVNLFNDLLRKNSNERKKCIIMADFNIDLHMVKQPTSFMACLLVHSTQLSVGQQESLNKLEH